jgi:hypothetical protein
MVEVAVEGLSVEFLHQGRESLEKLRATAMRDACLSSKEGRHCILRRCLRDLVSKSKFLKLHSGDLETLPEEESLSSHVLKREVSATGISASLNQSLLRLRLKRELETNQGLAIGRRSWIRLKDLIVPEETRMLSGSELMIQLNSMSV